MVPSVLVSRLGATLGCLGLHVVKHTLFDGELAWLTGGPCVMFDHDVLMSLESRVGSTSAGGT